MLGKEYYVLSKSKDNDMFIHCIDAETDDLMYEDDYLDPITLMRFYFDESMVKEPILYDLIDEGLSPLFSGRIKEILELFDYFPAMQYLKSVITFKDEVFGDYYYLHILNYISCVDKNQSIFKKAHGFENIHSFNKLVLSEEALKQKPLQQRLIFRVEEKESVILFHESVVEAVMKVEPTGLHFYPVEKWDTFITAR